MAHAILFDYFGVVASDDYWQEVKKLEQAVRHGDALAELSEEVNTGVITWRHFCTQVAADLGLSEAEVEERYRQHRLNRDVVAYIRHLKPKVKVCLASNAHHEHLEPILLETGLDELFDEVFLSSHLGAAKPDPHFFSQIAERLKVDPSECLLIDDSAYNIEGAITYGMQGIVFESADQIKVELTKLL